jgi:hypothetical protein
MLSPVASASQTGASVPSRQRSVKREARDRAGDHQNGDDPERTRAFARHQPCPERDQGRCYAARDRVDVRKVAQPIAVGERDVVSEMDRHRAAKVRPAGHGRRRHQEQQRQGTQPAHEVDRGQAHERIAADLDQGVPAGVQRRRQQHQRHDLRVHPFTAGDLDRRPCLPDRAGASSGFGR